MLLLTILLFVILTLTILFFIPASNNSLLKIIGLSSSGITLLLSILLIVQFDTNITYFQEITFFKMGSLFFNIEFAFGLDGISIFFILLTTLLIFLSVLFIWNEVFLKEYLICLFLIEILLLLVFSVLDLLLFYIFFEAILIPMYFIIGVWGSRERKLRAVYLLVYYTLFGSILMLLGILYIYSITGTLNLEYLLTCHFSFNQQYWLWLAFFLSFASKIPLFPFHIWLPEAHVEAPTVGSVLLAGILLKLGVFGFLRFSLALFPQASFYFSPLIYILSVCGIIYASLSAIRQTDFKRIIAYSSVSHMNLVTLGLFSFNVIGLEGAVIQSISHGFVSSAMFFMIGILYDRYHSRLLYYYGGLVHTMPIYSGLFLTFTMANIALPGTSSFVGEFLVLLGVFKVNILAALFGAIGIILCGAYSLWLYNRLVFGNFKISYTSSFKDLDLREISILLPLLCLVFLMGIYPVFFLDIIHIAVYSLSSINTL